MTADPMRMGAALRVGAGGALGTLGGPLGSVAPGAPTI
jgi:hypothetical protein